MTLPTEEEIARAICCPDGCDGDTGSGRPCDIRREDRTSMMQARAILALIRPAFEAKEREIERSELSRHRLGHAVREAEKKAEDTRYWERRALAAEAKLAQAVEVEREACAALSKTWLEDWGLDLQGTCDSYRDAAVSGRHNGRRIPSETAKAYARQFKDRSDAVYDCGELLAAAIRARAASSAIQGETKTP